MSDEIKFSELPLSYRLAQGSIFLAIFSAFASLKFGAKAMPVIVQQITSTILATIVLFGLLVSSYVLIRYPYLSLVTTDDEDYFTRTFPSSRSCAYTFLKLFSLSVWVIVAFVPFADGVVTQFEIGVLAYSVLMIGFMIFLLFAYSPVSHPTIATFIRTTLGIGIFLFPIFLPVLFIACIRCRAMLDAAAIDLTFGLPEESTDLN